MSMNEKVRNALIEVRDFNQTIMCLHYGLDDEGLTEKEVNESWNYFIKIFPSMSDKKHELFYKHLAVVLFEIQNEEKQSKNLPLIYSLYFVEIIDTEEQIKDWIRNKRKSKFLITDYEMIPGFEADSIIGIGPDAKYNFISRARAAFIHIY